MTTSLPAQLVAWWRTLHQYLASGLRRRREPVDDPARLRRFLDTRASYIAQTSLYGYLRTRAGMRYPELFDDDIFVESINIAKWHMWLACLSDLSLYAGGLLLSRRPGREEEVKALLRTLLAEILAVTAIPQEAGAEFEAHASEVLARLEACALAQVSDDEACFTESPAALVHWAPIIDELKELDAEIVRNSVRFHWQEVRRELRRELDAAAVLGTQGSV
jgi:hypothetical protein